MVLHGEPLGPATGARRRPPRDRNEDGWSVLRPADEHDARERLGALSFHFPAHVDDSGFVGWLADALKERLGTGVFVICGRNTGRGGIHDYRGCPDDLLDDAVAVLHHLTI